MRNRGELANNIQIASCETPKSAEQHELASMCTLISFNELRGLIELPSWLMMTFMRHMVGGAKHSTKLWRKCPCADITIVDRQVQLPLLRCDVVIVLALCILIMELARG